MKPFWICFIILSALIFLTTTASFAREFGAKRPTGVGDLIPDFTLPDAITGDLITFEMDIKNKSHFIALVFMSTTCSACRDEMELLTELTEDNPDRLKIYAIVVDLEGEKTVPEYSKQFKFNARYLLDPEFTLAPKFGFIYTPGLIISDIEGKIIYSRGGFSAEKMQEIKDGIVGALKKSGFSIHN